MRGKRAAVILAQQSELNERGVRGGFARTLQTGAWTSCVFADAAGVRNPYGLRISQMLVIPLFGMK